MLDFVFSLNDLSKKIKHDGIFIKSCHVERVTKVMMIFPLSCGGLH